MQWFKKVFRPDRQPPVPPPAPPPPTNGIYDGFEFDVGADWNYQTANPNNIKAINFPNARKGSRVLRVICNKSDPDVAGGPRSEILMPRSLGAWGEGTSVEVKGSILFPADYIDDPTQEIVWQVHNAGEGVPFLIQSINGDLLIRGKGFADVVIPKTKGKWMDIAVRHLWSATNGKTQVKVNGIELVDYSGPTMNPDYKMYQKFGMYKGGWRKPGSNTKSRTVYFDEIFIQPL